jgi:hypothetical protein
LRYWKNDETLERIVKKFMDGYPLEETELESIKLYLVEWINNFPFDIDPEDLISTEDGEKLDYIQRIDRLKTTSDLRHFIKQLNNKQVYPFR